LPVIASIHVVDHDDIDRSLGVSTVCRANFVMINNICEQVSASPVSIMQKVPTTRRAGRYLLHDRVR
jgi:hypothetical protein